MANLAFTQFTGKSHSKFLTQPMSSSRSMYICNSAYIYQNWNNISNADINKLGEMPKSVKGEFRIKWR